MKVTHSADFPVTDAACKKATGKTLKQWFAELDSIEGLKKGRRECIRYIYAQHADAWWPTTIFVEYEAHKKVVKKDGQPEGYTICVTKSIAAPVKKVYQTWTDPKSFADFFGDKAKQTVKEGGSFACQAGCQGEFTRVRPEKDLRFSWSHPECTLPMQVDVQFQDNKGKCLMNVMTSRVQTREEADGLRNAWTTALNRLKAICEA